MTSMTFKNRSTTPMSELNLSLGVIKYYIKNEALSLILSHVIEQKPYNKASKQFEQHFLGTTGYNIQTA